MGHLLSGGGSVRRLLLLLATAWLLAGPRGCSGDQAPAPHAAHGAADEAGPPPAVWGVGGVLAEELENPSQRQRRCLRTGRDGTGSSRLDIIEIIGLNEKKNQKHNNKK